ncbi:hypothetical protein MSG28_007912 [Choristoneura fumiferana]|uniref:Uncharacterized protein n=1 Tax=Choristoneura fumiferana TaxID=7141 RepID=A0ACC0J986_CHOFU|nr:hypothetical protein MSG28_007912 [Choristoneura fumiferana]
MVVAIRVDLAQVFPQTNMWSRKQSVCSAVSGTSKCDDSDSPLAGGVKIYPFAIALRVRVLQIVCGIGGLVVGAVGWLEERKEPELGLGVPAGAITVLAAGQSIYLFLVLRIKVPLSED